LDLSNIPRVKSFLNSFSTWGTENSLAEINLESGGGGEKGLKLFWGSKIGKNLQQQEKISKANCSWTNPFNALQEVTHYSFIKFCIYCFSLWYEFFEKIINMVLMRDLWNFSFFGRGDVSRNHSELCRFVSRSQAKHQVSLPVIILLKKNCLHRPSR